MLQEPRTVFLNISNERLGFGLVRGCCLLLFGIILFAFILLGLIERLQLTGKVLRILRLLLLFLVFTLSLLLVVLILVLFGVFLILLFRMLFIIQTIKDNFGVVAITGFVGMFFTHVFVNVGMAVGIMPVTGIPLYFLSYGGSSLIAANLAVGITMNIYSRRFRF